jgi:ZIP family zinc transporter
MLPAALAKGTIGLSSDFLTLLGIASSAAVASVAGGLLALWQKPTTLFTSVSLGFTSGILIGTIAFEMMPQAIKLGSVAIAAVGFGAGFVAVYLMDLFIHRGRLAGERAEQRRKVQLYYRRRQPRAGDAIVLAGGTSAEEVIEGIAIGAGTIVAPSLGILVGLAITIDNLSEGLSVGELLRGESPSVDGGKVREILGWTSTIGVSVFVSALLGWLLFRGLGDDVLAFLFATGAGAMFYLTITDLVPQAEARQYQESSAIANALGFVLILVLSSQI